MKSKKRIVIKAPPPSRGNGKTYSFDNYIKGLVSEKLFIKRKFPQKEKHIINLKKLKKDTEAQHSWIASYMMAYKDEHKFYKETKKGKKLNSDDKETILHNAAIRFMSWLLE